MKIFWGIFIGLLVLIFAGGFFAWNMVPSWLGKELSSKAGVKVSIGAIQPGFKTIKVHGLKVANLKRSMLKNALYIKEIISKAPVSRYFDKRVVIDELDIKNIYLGLEVESAKRARNNNFTVISDNLEKSLDQDKRKGQAGVSDRSLLIKVLKLYNINIEIAFREGQGKVRRPKPIRYLEYHNVSSEGGLPTAQIMKVIVSEIFKEVLSEQNIQKLIQDGIKSIQQKNPAPILDSIRSIFSKTTGKAYPPYLNEISQALSDDDNVKAPYKLKIAAT